MPRVKITEKKSFAVTLMRSAEIHSSTCARTRMPSRRYTSTSQGLYNASTESREIFFTKYEIIHSPFHHQSVVNKILIQDYTNCLATEILPSLFRRFTTKKAAFHNPFPSLTSTSKHKLHLRHRVSSPSKPRKLQYFN